jgi:hypothetical protein
MKAWKRFVLRSVLLWAGVGSLASAQVTAPVENIGVSYLGFYAGMPVADLLASVMRRDKTPFDLDVYCKPAYQPKSADDRVCNFPSAFHRQSGLRLESLSFSLDGTGGPVHYINISLAKTNPRMGALELERIVDEWESAGHVVSRSTLGGYVGSVRVEGCGLFAWIDEPEVKNKVEVSCVPMLVGDRPQLWVTLNRRTSPR